MSKLSIFKSRDSLSWWVVAFVIVWMGSLALFQDDILFFLLRRNGVEISQREFDDTVKSAKNMPSRCAIGVEVNDRCVVLGIKGLAIPVGTPRKQ